MGNAEDFTKEFMKDMFGGGGGGQQQQQPVQQPKVYRKTQVAPSIVTTILYLAAADAAVLQQPAGPLLRGLHQEGGRQRVSKMSNSSYRVTHQVDDLNFGYSFGWWSGRYLSILQPKQDGRAFQFNFNAAPLAS